MFSTRCIRRSPAAAPAAVYVSGPSGIGKSALMRSFLARVKTRDDVVVLSGRCYEHESIPYEALDGVVDSLSRYLMSLSQSAVESVLPHDIVALPRLFPVMLRVPAIGSACRERPPAIDEPSLVRRLAFDALRDLLARIAHPQAADYLYRRFAMGGCRWRAAARRAASAFTCPVPPDAGVVPQRRNRAQAISAKVAGRRRPPDEGVPPALADARSRSGRAR